MTPAVFLIVLSVLVLVLQTTSMWFLVPPAYKPDLVLVMVQWAGLRMNVIPGVPFAFISGMLVDLLSGSPTGFFALIYCLIFVASGLLNATFEMNRAAIRFAFSFIASLITAAAVLVMRWLSGPLGLGIDAVYWMAAKSLMTAAACLLVFPVVDRFWMGYSRIVGVR